MTIYDLVLATVEVLITAKEEGKKVPACALRSEVLDAVVAEARDALNILAKSGNYDVRHTVNGEPFLVRKAKE